MKFTIYGDASKGSREYQEDSFEFFSSANDNSRLLAVLCDGMGGHSGGEVASSTAVKYFIDYFNSVSDDTPPLDVLKQSLEVAHKEIIRLAEDDKALADMGTTLVALYLSGKDVYWVSVGDSHLYLCRKGSLKKLNADHSMAPVLDELVEIGRISKQEAETDPSRNSIRSCISADEIRLIDEKKQSNFVEPADYFILASDGLDTLPDDIVEQVIKKGKTPDLIAKTLLSEVNKVNKPSQDNTAVIVIRAKNQFLFF